MRLLFSSLCHTDLQVDEISAYICNLLALNQKNYLRTNTFGKMTVLATKVAEKDSSVFIKKKTLLSRKAHFCQQKDTSVIQFSSLPGYISPDSKRTVLCLIRTVLS